MSNYDSYFIAGPENILPNHQAHKESKTQSLVNIVKKLAQNGLDVFQLRAKTLNNNETIKLIFELHNAIKNTSTSLCINDNVQVAYKAKKVIDILHLGQSDMHPEEAQALLGDSIKIGLSITNIKQLNTIPKCVSYIGVGPIYATNSKNNASLPIGEEGLKNIILKVNLPVVAIGGIETNNLKLLFTLGVSGVAVISNILNSNDPLQNFIKFKEEINKGKERK